MSVAPKQQLSDKCLRALAAVNFTICVTVACVGAAYASFEVQTERDARQTYSEQELRQMALAELANAGDQMLNAIGNAADSLVDLIANPATAQTSDAIQSASIADHPNR